MKHPLIYVDIPDLEYDKLITTALEYALLSITFTFDRLQLHQKQKQEDAIHSRILNIVKGKLAENLFEYFCNINGIKADFESPKTPYYTIDKRDFYYKNTEYDLKNNFLYHDGDFYKNYLKLPALIPNRFAKDQWSTRLTPYEKSKVAHVFSFMKAANYKNNKRGQNFLELKLTSYQLQFILKYSTKYKGKQQAQSGFDKYAYLKEILQGKSIKEFYTSHFYPKLVIAGFATEQNWNLFKNTGPNEANAYQNQPILNWYKKVGKRQSLSFLEGCIWGTMKNKTLPVSMLFPITDLFASLKNRVVGGNWLKTNF